MTKKGVYIKKSNYWMLYDFVRNRIRPEMQGTKLKAVFKLIESKGEPIETDCNKLKGVKALQIAEGEYIAMKRTGINGSFYPCCLQTYLLTELKTKITQ